MTSGDSALPSPSTTTSSKRKSLQPMTTSELNACYETSSSRLNSNPDQSITQWSNSASVKPSSIPRPQTTPTKSTSLLTPFGYKSPTTHGETHRSKPNTPTRISSDPFASKSISNYGHKAGSSVAFNKQTLDNIKEKLRVKEEELSELKNNILTLQTQSQQIEVDNQGLDDKLSLSSKELKIKSNELESILVEKDDQKADIERSFELKSKHMEIDIETSKYNIEKVYMSQIENIMTTKVQAVQERKSNLTMKLTELESLIIGNDSELQESISSLKMSFSDKKSHIREHMESSRRLYEEEVQQSLKQRLLIESQIEDLKQTLDLESSNRDAKSKNLYKLKRENEVELREIETLKESVEQLKDSLKQKVKNIKQLEENIETKEKEQTFIRKELINEETKRRKLHDIMQELKGNIRVFCRVRPPLETEKDLIEIQVPENDEEEQDIELKDPKATVLNPYGNTLTTPKSQTFAFDRVFEMESSNLEIFEEISQLVQTALDGFNVCVFAYGQTGSGKTYTMSSKTGMIPRAVEQIFETSKKLQEQGWTHKIYGEFLEIYNENINDLLGNPNSIDKFKYEIRHDTVNQRTSVSDLSRVELTSSHYMTEILDKALNNRSMAATKANERSSRSHTVFIIRIYGHNKQTGVKTEGTLNLIDLAGSERLSHSQVSGDRLKETQAINKSLSCLGDVIHALGDKDSRKHIPFRNSKLTYLLQYSLSGDSKTLMFVNISPSAIHFNETINSLRFATKVNNTKMDKARKSSTTGSNK